MINDEQFGFAARSRVNRGPLGFGFRVMVTLACVCWHLQSWATGGFEEEPLQTLTDYLRLGQLPAKSVDQIREEIDKAAPKPHWRYVSGAVEYLAHQMGESQPYFLKVAKDYPKSPRAEAALYMAARGQMWKSRAEGYTQQDMQLVAAERPKAKKLWDEYFAKYPHGRFFGDALGWYAAYAFDGHDFGTALRCYAQQLDLPDHPELADMAAEMVEKTLSHIASAPKDKAFAEVAKHPQAAQALVYLV